MLKIIRHYILKIYRHYTNDNLKKIVIIGNTNSSKDIRNLLISNKELGYEILGVFSDVLGKDITGNIEGGYKYIEFNNEIDEIFCAIDELSEDQVNEFVRHAGIQDIELKFIPEGKKQYVKSLRTDYFSYLPILSIEKPALNNEVNQFIKRLFDVFFSILVIVFVISWLIPICALLIKIESKGPILFKHNRNGINYKEFICYKLRSLKAEPSKDNSHVKEEDSRVTKVGRFLRRTSIDELPQFFNVLFGEMSVVGPRPHMLPFTSEYSKKIDKYIFTYRHIVKPGITGLAQVKGCRGEIKKDEDIINRVKYDVFYIENWSLLLDIKIIVQTIFNIIKGEQKAY
jgi:putative colanic acid biosynthesis UDP-glucose lipid carrier transferase